MATQVDSYNVDPFNKKIFYVDPSEHFRPEGKPSEDFRRFSLHDVSTQVQGTRSTGV